MSEHRESCNVTKKDGVKRKKDGSEWGCCLIIIGILVGGGVGLFYVAAGATILVMP